MRVRRAAYSASDRARKKAPMAIEIRLKKDGKGWLDWFMFLLTVRLPNAALGARYGEARHDTSLTKRSPRTQADISLEMAVGKA